MLQFPFSYLKVPSFLLAQELGKDVATVAVLYGFLLQHRLSGIAYVQGIAAFIKKELNTFRVLQRKIFSFASVDPYLQN